ncbi:hypothetical protein ACN077_06515 [Clostridium chromiireducens]|uniref:hypothetical protein n=1 Tax=Clostridium chromiireducens TaxID=225345 RepID=UPI003AF75FCA
MIRRWLREEPRDSDKYYFDIIDMDEIKMIDDEILDYLGGIILESYRNKENLKKKFQGKTEDDLKDYLSKLVFPNIKEFSNDKQNQPRKNVMQGDFGEILTSEIIRKIRNLEVPIVKMSYKFNNNKSVFCTDILAHNFGEKITDLTYFEVKTRVNNEKKDQHYIAYNAANSLIHDQQSDNSEAIADYLQRYYYDLSIIAAECSNYEVEEKYLSLSARYMDIVLNSEKYNKNFEVAIIMEKDKYNDDIIEDLNTLNFPCGSLKITIILLKDIIQLYKIAFEYALKYSKKYVFSE